MSTTDRGDVQWLRISQRNPLAAATPSPLASGRLKNTSGRPLRSRPNALPANYQLPAVTPGSLRKTLGTARTTWAAGASAAALVALAALLELLPRLPNRGREAA